MLAPADQLINVNFRDIQQIGPALVFARTADGRPHQGTLGFRHTGEQLPSCVPITLATLRAAVDAQLPLICLGGCYHGVKIVGFPQ